MLRSEEVPAEYSSNNNTAVGNKNVLVNLLINELFKLFYIFILFLVNVYHQRENYDNENNEDEDVDVDEDDNNDNDGDDVVEVPMELYVSHDAESYIASICIVSTYLICY